ncbi:MAG: IspD/TarI family cytidylyltransferase [Actinomycetes bacterium]
MKSQMRAAVVVLAAGSGSRFGHVTNKVWLPLSGRRIISRSLVNATKSFRGCRTILIINPDDAQLAKTTLAREVTQLKVEIVPGGATRHESEYHALTYLAPEIESGEINVVLIHDGARPLATSSLFRNIAEAAHRHGGALPAIKVSLREMDLQSSETVVRVQTPQAFQAEPLLTAYRQAYQDEFHGTDTAACMEKYFPDIQTKAVEGEVSNVKITYPQDLAIAEHVLEVRRYKD